MTGYYPTLGFDPAPGDVASVDDLRTTITRVASRLTSANTSVQQLGKNDSMWQGEGARAFARRVGDFPKHLTDAETSMSAACRALASWSVNLVDFQRQAASYERQAADAAASVASAKSAAAGLHQPGVDATPQQKDDAKTSATAAKNKVDAAGDELTRIIGLANKLLDNHNDMAKTVAKSLHDASDVAPAKPGFFSRLGSALSDAFNFVVSLPGKAWDWVKKHADLIAVIGDVLSDISTVLAIVATVCMFIPPLEAVSGVLFLASAGFAGGALLAHGLAKAAGADVSWGTIALDVVGVATGGAGKVADIGMQGAKETIALGKTADVALDGIKGLEGMRSGYTEIGENAIVHFAKISKAATIIGTAGVEAATWNPWFGNLYSDVHKVVPPVVHGVEGIGHKFLTAVGGGNN